jgi:DNA-binding transcriptional LysR family regulator
MELRHLRYFVAAVEERSLQGAAQRMNVAQPALSRRIRDLEAMLGCNLLERSARGVSPTPAGAKFYREVVMALEALNRASYEARQMGIEQNRVVRLGLVRTSRKYVFTHEAIAAFNAEDRHANIAFTSEPSPSLALALRDRHLDLTLLYEPFLGVPGFGERVIHKEHFVLAIHPSHRLAVERPAELAELAGVPLVLLTRRENAEFHDRFLQELRLTVAEPIISHIANSYEELIDTTIASGGVCVSAASTMLSTPPGVLRYRPLPGLRLDLPLKLAWRVDIQGRPASQLLACMNAAINRHQAQIASGEAAWASLFGYQTVTLPEASERTDLTEATDAADRP